MAEEHTIEIITGKSIDKLTETELASALSLIEARQKTLREAQQKEQFNTLATTAKKMAEALGWPKLLKITLTPDDSGKKYEVGLGAIGAKTSAQRTAPDVNGGKITISKIGAAKGGIAQFKDKAGGEHNTIQDLVKALKQPDGTPEADRCWDISKKGISASDIVIKYHADEVTLVYQNGDEQLVKDAVEEVEKARATA